MEARAHRMTVSVLLLGVDIEGHELGERTVDVLGCGGAVAQRITQVGEVRFCCPNRDL